MTATLIDIREQGYIGNPPLPAIGKLLFQLIGEPFLFARFTYGDELTLHFGTLRDARHAKLRDAGIKYGSHVLRSRGSGWLLKSGSQGSLVFEGIQDHLNLIILAAESKRITDKEIESGNFLTPGTLVYKPFISTVVQVDGIGVRLDMTDGSSVFIVPTPDEPLPADSPELPELADWELETPHGTLRVGPGMKWTWQSK